MILRDFIKFPQLLETDDKDGDEEDADQTGHLKYLDHFLRNSRTNKPK